MIRFCHQGAGVVDDSLVSEREDTGSTKGGEAGGAGGSGGEGVGRAGGGGEWTAART